MHRRSSQLLAIGLLLGASLAWGKPFCVPTHPWPRERLYPESNPYEKMSVRKLEKLAAADNREALNVLGVLYGTGQKVKKDSTRSFEFYARAADLGLPIAQANLSYMYFAGEGTTKDAKRAFDWALKAIDAGEARGQMQAGYQFGLGEGVEKNLKEAAFCYLLAARQGNVEAQHTIANIYSTGYGIPEDHAESLLWRQRARTAFETKKPWVDDSPLTEMPEAWTPPFALVEYLAAAAEVRTPNYSFRVQAPPTADATSRWGHYSVAADPLNVTLLMGVEQRDNYAVMVQSGGPLLDGENLLAAINRLRPGIKYQPFAGRRDCMIMSDASSLPLGDMAAVTGFCLRARDSRVFEIIAARQSLSFKSAEHIGLQAIRELADQARTAIGSFRFE
jgi:hypothetical protein